MVSLPFLLIVNVLLNGVVDGFLHAPFVTTTATTTSRRTKNHVFDLVVVPAFVAVASSRREDNDMPAISLFDDDDYDENGRREESEERHIPISGISVSDEMEAAQRDQFVTEVVPVEGMRGVAQLVTNPLIQYAFEPVRYLVALSIPESSSSSTTTTADDLSSSSLLLSQQQQQQQYMVFENASFAMVDVPPYSPQLVTRMKAFMGINHTLAAILVTSSDAIHYEEAPQQMYSLTRRGTLLNEWRRAFPEAAVVTYRLDTPRDCQEIVTQKLDGRGPFAWDTATNAFVETGRPLRPEEWDQETARSVMSGAKTPEEVLDHKKEQQQQQQFADDDILYTADAVRAREQGRSILAIPTPGHSFGSVSYVFPQMGVCCSGYTIPVEDTRRGGDDDDEGENIGAGPALDVRGYITTSRAGISRQMQSARMLVQDYMDRFYHVLPSRGDPLMLDERSETEERQEILMAIIDQYDKIGQIYEQLGITSSSSDDDDDDDNDDFSP